MRAFFPLLSSRDFTDAGEQQSIQDPYLKTTERNEK